MTYCQCAFKQGTDPLYLVSLLCKSVCEREGVTLQCCVVQTDG